MVGNKLNQIISWVWRRRVVISSCFISHPMRLHYHTSISLQHRRSRPTCVLQVVDESAWVSFYTTLWTTLRSKLPVEVFARNRFIVSIHWRWLRVHAIPHWVRAPRRRGIVGRLPSHRRRLRVFIIRTPILWVSWIVSNRRSVRRRMTIVIAILVVGVARTILTLPIVWLSIHICPSIGLVSWMRMTILVVPWRRILWIPWLTNRRRWMPIGRISVWIWRIRRIRRIMVTRITRRIWRIVMRRRIRRVTSWKRVSFFWHRAGSDWRYWIVRRKCCWWSWNWGWNWDWRRDWSWILRRWSLKYTI